MKAKALFITLEGIDGTGKTTQHRLLVEHLRTLGWKVCDTREPGGTKIGEMIRSLLMDEHNKHMDPMTELALITAARAQHLREVVRPALEQGKVVVSDRFNDASLAYQGYGRKLGIAAVHVLDRLICGHTQPGLTLVLDLPAVQSLARARSRDRSGTGRFEAQGVDFQERVRQGYLTVARREPGRVKIVRAHRSVEDVQAEIRDLVEAFLADGRRGARPRKPSPSSIRKRKQ